MVRQCLAFSVKICPPKTYLFKNRIWNGFFSATCCIVSIIQWNTISRCWIMHTSININCIWFIVTFWMRFNLIVVISHLGRRFPNSLKHNYAVKRICAGWCEISMNVWWGVGLLLHVSFFVACSLLRPSLSTLRRSRELCMLKWKSYLTRTQSLQVLPLKPGASH